MTARVDISKGSLMQHALILTRLIPEQDSVGRVCALNGVTHDGRAVHIGSDEQQRINVTSLEFQQLPLVLLTDQLESHSEGLQVPSGALLAVVPIASDQVKGLIGDGQGERLLRVISEQLV